MIKLLILCIQWSAIGRLIRSIARIPVIITESFNNYLSYLEAIWHYDRPSFFKTIYFNFRVCRFGQAVSCPIFIYGKTRIWSLSGNVRFEDCNIKSGMIKWGYDWGYRSNGTTIIRLQGSITFKGNCLLAKASDIAVFPNAKLVVGGGGKILENTLIYCTRDIYIGQNFSFTFQSSIMDTDFHYMVDIKNASVRRNSASIHIGDNVWIGNRATIKKGVIIPDNTIVAASYSVLTKDYSDIPPYSILGGCPAKLLSTGFSRIWKNEISNSEKIDDIFIKNPQLEYITIDRKEINNLIYECK